MKTGEEKFDDEIRQKLRHSEVKPPAGLFDVIVPPPDKKKWFLWIWVAGIVILGSTAVMMHNHSSNNTSINSSIQIPETSTATTSKFTSTTTSSDDNLSTNSAITKESLNKNDSNNKTTQSNNSVISTGKSYESAMRGQEFDDTNNLTTTLLKNKKSQSQNNTSIYYANLKKESAGTNNFYFGKTATNSELIYNYDHLYNPAISLPYTEKDFIKQPTKIIKKDSLALTTHIPTKYSLELSASQVYYYSTISSQTTDTTANRLLNAKTQESPSSKGVDVGLKLRYSLKKHFSLAAGINYSTRKEEFAFSFTEYYKEISIDTINYFILFPFSPPLLVTEYDSLLINRSRNIPIKHDITYNVISFSCEIRYEIPMGRFVVEPQAGFIIDIFSQKKGTSNFNSNFENVNAKDYYKQNIQTRIKGGLQFSYSLGEKIDIFD